MTEENIQGAEAQNPQENTPQHNPADTRAQLFNALQARGEFPEGYTLEQFNTKLQNPVVATQLFQSLQSQGEFPEGYSELDFITKATRDFHDIDDNALNVMHDYENQLEELDTQIANIGKDDSDLTADFASTKNEFGGVNRAGDIKKEKESDLKQRRAELELERSAKLAEMNVMQNLDGSPTIHGMQSQGKQLYAEAGKYMDNLTKEIDALEYEVLDFGGGSAPQRVYKDPTKFEELSEKREKLQTTRNALSEVVNSTLTPESFKGIGDGFKAAIRDKNLELLPFIGDVQAISRNLQNSGAVGRLKEIMDEGESYDDALAMLEEEDQFLIKSSLLSTNFGAEAGDLKNTWFNAGSGFAETLPFLVELAATGGVRAAVSKTAAAKLGGKRLAVKARNRAAIKAGSGNAATKLAALREVPLTLGERATLATANVIGTSVQAAALPNEVLKNATERMKPEMVSAYGEAGEAMVTQILDGENSTEALLKGYGLTWSELYTEQAVGKWFDDISTLAGSGISKQLSKAEPQIKKQLTSFFKKPENLMSNALGRYAVKAGKAVDDMVLDPIAKTVDGVPINGILGEYMEELANIPLQNFITGDNDLFVGITDGEGNIDTENLRNIFNQTLVSTGALKTPKFASQGLKTGARIIEASKTQAYRAKNQETIEEIPNLGIKLRGKELFAIQDFLGKDRSDEDLVELEKQLLKDAPAELKGDTKKAIEFVKQAQENKTQESRLNTEEKDLLRRIREAKSPETLAVLQDKAKGNEFLLKNAKTQEKVIENRQLLSEQEVADIQAGFETKFGEIADSEAKANAVNKVVKFNPLSKDVSIADEIQGIRDALSDFTRTGEVTSQTLEAQGKLQKLQEVLPEVYFKGIGKRYTDQLVRETGMPFDRALKLLVGEAKLKLQNNNIIEQGADLMRDYKPNNYLNKIFNNLGQDIIKEQSRARTGFTERQHQVSWKLKKLQELGLNNDQIRRLATAPADQVAQVAEDIQNEASELGENIPRITGPAGLSLQNLRSLANVAGAFGEKSGLKGLSDDAIGFLTETQGATSVDTKIAESTFEGEVETTDTQVGETSALTSSSNLSQEDINEFNEILDDLDTSAEALYFDLGTKLGIDENLLLNALKERNPDITLEQLQSQITPTTLVEVGTEANIAIEGFNIGTDLPNTISDLLGLPLPSKLSEAAEEEVQAKKVEKRVANQDNKRGIIEDIAAEGKPDAARVTEARNIISDFLNTEENKSKGTKAVEPKHVAAFGIAWLTLKPSSFTPTLEKILKSEGMRKVGAKSLANTNWIDKKTGREKAFAPRFQEQVLPKLEGYSWGEIRQAIVEYSSEQGFKPELWHSNLKNEVNSKADAKKLSDLSESGKSNFIEFGDNVHDINKMDAESLGALQQEIYDSNPETLEGRLEAIQNMEKIQYQLESRFDNSIPQGTYDIFQDEFGSANFVTLGDAMSQIRDEVQKNPTEENRNAFALIQSLAEVFGNDLKIHKSTGDVINGEFVSGNRFDPNTGRVYLSLAETKALGSSPIVALAHELDHKLHYDTLEVVDTLIKSGASLDSIENSLHLLPEAIQQPARELVTKFLDAQKSILPKLNMEIAKERAINPDLDTNTRLRELVTAKYALSDIMEFSAGAASANNVRVLQSLELDGNQKGILSKVLEVVKNFRDKLYKAFGIDASNLGLDVIDKFRQGLIDLNLENVDVVEKAAPRFLAKKPTAKNRIKALASKARKAGGQNITNFSRAVLGKLESRSNEFSPSALSNLDVNEQANKVNKISEDYKEALAKDDRAAMAKLEVELEVEKLKLKLANNFDGKNYDQIFDDLENRMVNQVKSSAANHVVNNIAHDRAARRIARGMGAFHVTDLSLKAALDNQTSRKKAYYGIKKAIKSLLNQTMNWSLMNEMLVGDNPHVQNHLVGNLQRARFDYTQRGADQQDFIFNGLSEFKGKSASSRNFHYANEAAKTKIEVKIQDERGVEHPKTLNADQAALIYLISQMPNQEMYAGWMEANGISLKTIEQVKKQLPAKYKRLADKSLQRMQKINGDLSAYAGERLNTPIFGLTSMNADGTYDSTITDIFSDKAAIKALDTKKLRLEDGMMNAVIATEDIANRFIAFRDTFQEMEDVITNDYFRRAFIEKNGEDAYKQYTKLFGQIKNGVARKNNALAKAVNFIFSNAVVSAIGLAPRIFLTQISSFPVYFREYNPVRVAKAYAGLATEEGGELINYINENSGLLKTRGEESFKYFDVNRAPVAGAQTDTWGKISHYNQQISGFLVKKGDRAAIKAGGFAFAKIKYDEYIEQGMSKQEAMHNALVDFETESAKAQQSQNIEERSLLQNNQFLKYINAFKTTPLQYGRISTSYLLKTRQAALNGDYGKALHNMYRWGAFQMLSQVPYYWIQQGMDIGWDDEEEWELRNLGWKSVTSNILNMIPVLGDIVNAALEKEVIESPYMQRKGWGDVIVGSFFDKILAGQPTKIQKALNTEEGKGEAIAILAAQLGTGIPVERLQKNWISAANLLAEGDYENAIDSWIHGVNKLKYDGDISYSEAEELKKLSVLMGID